MPYTICCSTADNTRASLFWVESRDRIPTRAEAEAIRLLLSSPPYVLPKLMTLDDLEDALYFVTGGRKFRLLYKNNTLVCLE